MKTRVGKIARLPHDIREQLNQRLFNGALGPELMNWLNALPEVQQVLSDFFESSPNGGRAAMKIGCAIRNVNTASDASPKKAPISKSAKTVANKTSSKIPPALPLPN